MGLRKTAYRLDAALPDLRITDAVDQPLLRACFARRSCCLPTYAGSWTPNAWRPSAPTNWPI